MQPTQRSPNKQKSAQAKVPPGTQRHSYAARSERESTRGADRRCSAAPRRSHQAAPRRWHRQHRNSQPQARILQLAASNCPVLATATVEPEDSRGATAGSAALGLAALGPPTATMWQTMPSPQNGSIQRKCKQLQRKCKQMQTGAHPGLRASTRGGLRPLLADVGPPRPVFGEALS